MCCGSVVLSCVLRSKLSNKQPIRTREEVFGFWFCQIDEKELTRASEQNICIDSYKKGKEVFRLLCLRP